MAEISSTIKFYLHTGLHKDKNFIIESFDSYLSQFLDVEKTTYQYVKHQMSLSYKMDISQNKLEMINANDIDYVSIKNSNESKTYFYFVINKVWKSTSTIEFELEMDTLNTFSWNNDYIVDKKTFVRREHKDRLRNHGIKNIVVEAPNIDVVQRIRNGITDPEEHYEFLLDIDKFLSLNYQGMYPINTFHDNYYGDELHAFSIKVYYKNGTLFFSSNNVSFIGLYDDFRLVIYYWDNGTEVILSFDLSPNNYNIIVGYKKYIGILDMGILASYNDIYIYDDVIQIYFSQLVKSYEYSYERIIDKFPENINPVLFKKSEKHLLDLDNYDNWYLVYANQNAVGSSDNDYSQLYVNPVEIMFARDTIYKIATRIAVPITIYPSNITKRPNEGECLQIIDINADVGAYVEIGGTRYNYSSTLGDGNYNAISIFKFGDYDTTFKYIYLYKLNTDGQPTSTITLQNVSAITFYGIPNGKLSTFQGYQFDFTSWWTAKGGSVFYINSSSQATARTSDSYNDIDLTYSQLIKIIALPYAPLEFLNGVYTFESIPDELSWNTTFNFLQVKPSKRIEFDYIIDFGYNSPFSDLVCEENIGAFTKVPRNDIFESKFYNSEFTQNKFVYDQFTFTFQLELVDINEFFAQENYDKFMVEYIVSKKLSSKFIFKFNQYVCGEYEKQDYNNVLIVDRNNEVPLFTNAYINYMRTGFQFDVSNKNNQQVSRWGGIALSTIGAVASFISSAYTGGVGIAGGIALTTSTLSQIVGAITSQNQQENAMAQKQLQASMQSESVQGSDDVELFKQYGQNKAKLVKYQPSEVMSQMIKDLFYYGGYATSEYKIPNINTRIYFNYLQCDLVLDGTSNLPEDIENDIKTKFQSGCTFFHKYDGVWDIAQEYENFEIVFE